MKAKFPLEITYNIEGFFQPLRLVVKVRPVSLVAHAQVQGFFDGVKWPMIPRQCRPQKVARNIPGKLF
jgi:hypothetical protein